MKSDYVKESILESIALKQAILSDRFLMEDIHKAAVACMVAVRDGNKILLAGNGGSAADAQHLAAELVGRYKMERLALPALALTTDTSALTAISNDYGYEFVFDRQLQALGRAGDVFIGISTSGYSPNILRALERAKELNIITIGLTGSSSGAPMPELCDYCLRIPSTDTARIQECHIMIGHIICGYIEERLFRTYADTENEIAATVEELQANGVRIVMANGCFDMLHAGHIHHLQQAAKLGDRLLVAINDDDSVRRLKGNARPINDLQTRMADLDRLPYVDWVLSFSEDTPARLIERLTPNVLVKGGDYKPDDIVGADYVRRNGGQVVVLDLLPGYSTSSIIAGLRHGD